ncbi:MAG: hypothetical protein ACJ77K_12815 [Bacteroidia bacterium]
MSQNLKDNERELIKQVNYFKKRAEKFITEEGAEGEHSKLVASCEKLVETIHLHAAKRNEILVQRKALQEMIKDNAACPKCNTNGHLKHIGVDTSDNGWKCNKYRCRKCNIEFVWVKPNNPWDLVPCLERMIANIEEKFARGEANVISREDADKMIAQVQESLSKLRPVIEASDLDWQELTERDADMDKIVNEFKMHLQIERIKMDAMEN